MKRLFLTSSVNLVAEDIIRHIPNAKGMKLAFISTASEGEKGDKIWLNEDRQALVNARFDVFDYTVTGKKRDRIKQDLYSADVIFFSGGNTFYLLEKIQQSDCMEVIRTFINKGKIYIGSSAGSVIAGPDIYPAKRLDNASKAPNIKGYEGFGFVNFVVFPHWGSREFKNLYLKQRFSHAYTENHAIILLTNYQYVLAEDDMYKIITV